VSYTLPCSTGHPGDRFEPPQHFAGRIAPGQQLAGHVLDSLTIQPVIGAVYQSTTSPARELGPGNRLRHQLVILARQDGANALVVTDLDLIATGRVNRVAMQTVFQAPPGG